MALQFDVAKDPFTGDVRLAAYARVLQVEADFERTASAAVTLGIYPSKITSDAAKTDTAIQPLERRRLSFTGARAATLADGGRAAAYTAVKTLDAYSAAADV